MLSTLTHRLANVFRPILVIMTRLFPSGSRQSALPEAQIIPRDQHPISRKQVSRAALNVLYGLHKAGFQAFLVGGCLRDMLTGRQPKDFDVATDATPEQVQMLFKRSRIIGRRFRIVHVRFGPEIIEVSTFRALNRDDSLDKDQHDAHEQTGLVLRDNTWGSIQEDALRRDFTVNALYYNIADFSLHDFVGSLKDIDKEVIHLIGDPRERYREDPVRMLRAARFAAKLGFTLAPDTANPIQGMAELLLQVPPARLFDEVLKLLLSGHARGSYEQLNRLGLFGFLFPDTLAALENDPDGPWQAMILAALDNTDRRLADNKPVTPAFLYAVFLWPVIQGQMPRYLSQGLPPAQALHKAAGQALSQQVKHTAVPKRFSAVMREMWELQLRLDKRKGSRANALMSHPRFRAAYDFLLLREQAGEIPAGLGDWWTRYQEVDETERQKMVQQLGNSSGGRKRRRRRPRRSHQS